MKILELEDSFPAFLENVELHHPPCLYFANHALSLFQESHLLLSTQWNVSLLNTEQMLTRVDKVYLLKFTLRIRYLLTLELSI